jgi:hypothetical protein
VVEFVKKTSVNQQAVAGVSALLIILAIVIGVSAGGGSGSDSTPASPAAQLGFNIPVALGKDIGAQATVNQTDGSSPTVDCIPAAAHQFTCHSTWSDGTPGQTMTATVSPGGTTWMTDSN